jgi:NTE family protein
MVALSFSGGGTRAAAFSFGVLNGLDAIQGEEGHTLLDDVMFISSVSGGSLTAAYYGLHGKEGLASFREQVLLRDGEAELRLSLFNPVNWIRLSAGGMNDINNLQRWLDRDVFHGATFADLARRGRPEIWINASDMYHRVAFPFSAGAFDALCSDLYSLPVSVAVARRWRYRATSLRSCWKSIRMLARLRYPRPSVARRAIIKVRWCCAIW